MQSLFYKQKIMAINSRPLNF